MLSRPHEVYLIGCVASSLSIHCLTHIENTTFHLPRLESGSFPLSFLPQVKPPGAIAGQVQTSSWGIPTGATVGVALGDFQCSLLACLSNATDAGTVVSRQRTP